MNNAYMSRCHNQFSIALLWNSLNLNTLLATCQNDLLTDDEANIYLIPSLQALKVTKFFLKI